MRGCGGYWEFYIFFSEILNQFKHFHWEHWLQRRRNGLKNSYWNERKRKLEQTICVCPRGLLLSWDIFETLQWLYFNIIPMQSKAGKTERHLFLSVTPSSSFLVRVLVQHRRSAEWMKVRTWVFPISNEKFISFELCRRCYGFSWGRRKESLCLCIWKEFCNIWGLKTGIQNCKEQ